ncbi:MAG: conjugal transfer protein TraH [Syntrophales bacterium]|nr:conjugal transfer protein TraH [Syntrophales bacterium]
MPLQRTWACLLLISLIISPASLANADLNASLNEMFTRWGGRVNVTSPGAYDAQTRGFIVGGSLSARVPQDTLQPFSIKAPSIKAGCGGIDIFGGSFSFINADQFVQFMQSIGQNALGYAFSLGLEAVCPTCNSVIKWLREKMDMLNKFNMDSCMAAKALVNSAGSGAGLWDLEACKQKKGGGDPVTGWLECASGNEANVRQQIKGVSDEDTADANANKTTGAKQGAATVQALKWFGLSDSQKQQIVSVLGTWYTKSDNETSSCSYQTPTLTLADLVQGGSVRLVKCGTGGFGDGEKCEDVTTESTTISGFAKLTRDKMASILAKYKSKSALTSDEQEFVNAIPIPPVAYMLRNSLMYSEQLANSLIDLTSDVAGAMMAWQMIENYIKIFEGGQSQIGTLCGKNYADIAEQIKLVRAERQELFEKYTKGLEMQAVMLSFMASIDAKVAANASHKINQALNYGKSGS